jgi:hypothetical protein
MYKFYIKNEIHRKNENENWPQTWDNDVVVFDTAIVATCPLVPRNTQLMSLLAYDEIWRLSGRRNPGSTKTRKV